LRRNLAMKTVFIDGQEGTTGLKIRERLAGRTDFQLIEIDPAKRKDELARRELLLSADVAILCLPDDASRQAYQWVHEHDTRLIDTSTAHRVAPGWAYGLPELSAAHREAVRGARFVANPGCHATGFLIGVYPLVAAGLLPTSYPFVVNSLTGYSGGGKKLIAKYEQGDSTQLSGPQPYSLTLKHKHLPEMQRVAGLEQAPAFLPIRGPFYKGMVVSTLVHLRLLARPTTAAALREQLATHYANEPFIRVLPFAPDAELDDGGLSPLGCNDTNRADIFVFGHDDLALVAVRLDNLGKGASGAAIQNLNLMLGVSEETGLQ
jgi:N-acetyl-gamma-glutamyl-phosphate reductase